MQLCVVLKCLPVEAHYPLWELTQAVDGRSRFPALHFMAHHRKLAEQVVLKNQETEMKLNSSIFCLERDFFLWTAYK